MISQKLLYLKKKLLKNFSENQNIFKISDKELIEKEFIKDSNIKKLKKLIQIL